MKWDDDYTLEDTTDTRRGLLQLAMYAMHVGTGNSLFCRTIKVATVKQYVRAAATFLALFGERPRDFRKEFPTDTRDARIINSVYDELARWEKQPKRREPYTTEMLGDLANTVSSTRQGRDSLLAATLDWFECGLFAGFRKSEWAQDAYKTSMDDYKKDFKHEARAFCLRDIRFEDNKRRRLAAAQVVDNDADETITKCWLTFRTQKNGQNGEEKLFTRNLKKGGHDLVRPMLRILRRFARLKGMNDFNTPLALYRNEGDEFPRFITSTDIERCMRQSAARVYKLDPAKDFEALQLWSAHSLRVGACNLLHAMGYTESQIQWLLRWRSLAFMAYLRNMVFLANRHTQTMDKAAAMPHLF